MSKLIRGRRLLMHRRKVVGLFCLTMLLIGCVTMNDHGLERALKHMTGAAISHYIDKDGVCENALPYAKMHDLRIKEIENYQKIHIQRIGGVSSSYDNDPPPTNVLPPGSSVAYWNCKTHKTECENPAINAENHMQGSAWTADGVEAFNIGPRQKDDKFQIWVNHEKYVFLTTKRTHLKGNAVAFFGFFPGNFGHVLHDNLPVVAWLRSIAPKDATFILPATSIYRNLIEFIDPVFFEKIYWYHANEVVTVEEGTLTVANPSYLLPARYGNTLFRFYRHWIFDNHPDKYADDKKLIIFYRRGGSHTHHGRVLNPKHEQDILNLIRANMAKYGRQEELVIFTGMDIEGETLPLITQFDTFRRASTIIGPHGSGLANSIWTNPFPESCDDRVRMLEFIPGSDSKQVQMPYYNGYYWVMRGMPIDWNQITYASNSTEDITYIRLPDLQRALDSMWGSSTD